MGSKILRVDVFPVNKPGWRKEPTGIDEGAVYRCLHISLEAESDALTLKFTAQAVL